ncbi:hypothetical protein CRI94_04485 [Longibacter salinarum]|uniref:Outer membrane protein beta-barrel domain-containing protein n=1 Tax=Longibacter salinarum TaxID=1850348 RepID=A0A2A8D0A2_9BACT|nr:porin family protein [Longibacter salinarum]PEN14300.1 hypothetical protein CRI94_04485 [Longibacter salinarum]
MIKKLTLAGLLLLLIGASPTFAQIDIKPGVSVGLNLASVRGDDAPDELDRRNGFRAGAILMIDPVGPLAFQPEVLYQQKGYKSTIESGRQEITSTYKINYAQINGLVKFQVPLAGPVSPSFFAGPAIGFKVSESVERSGDTGTISFPDQDASGTDVSAILGLGMDISIGVTTLTVDARYGLGLTNLPEDGDTSIKNSTFGISAGVLF